MEDYLTHKVFNIKNWETVEQARSTHKLTLRMMSRVKFELFYPLSDFDPKICTWERCAKKVPKYLTVQQKNNRKNVCPDLLLGFFSHVNSGDVSWIFECSWNKMAKPRVAHCQNSLIEKKPSLFIDSREISTKNLCPKSKLSTKRFINKF